ncbi:hypothetical protein [Novosphingobium sp. ERN07]|uniref:hypothetical protein n=1 Tax=Novosphingobium sp. ERN07 TaxID=2726187 RepID=UPI001F105602|nr:hypothetical protein [Novosphingobium sp. ERN07]
MTDHAGLAFFDDEDLLVLRAAPFRDLGTIAKGRRRPVPETLARVLEHRPMNVLGVFA